MGWRDLFARRPNPGISDGRARPTPAHPPPQSPSPPPSASAAYGKATLDRYFELLEHYHQAQAAKNYRALRDICVATAELLPAAVDAFWTDHSWHRTDPATGNTVAVPPSIPALDDLAHLAAAHQDRDLLRLLSETVAARPDLSCHEDLVARTDLHLRLTGEVLELVAGEPGVVQSSLGKRLGVHGRDTRAVVLWLDKTGQVEPVRDGKQWRLYLPGTAPSPAPPDTTTASADAGVPPANGQAATASPRTRPRREGPAPTPPARTAIDGCGAGTFVAIDFETATAQRASACALAVTVVDDGQVTARQSWLIRPPGNRYDPFNMYLHGIGPDDTANSPGFVDVMDDALAVIDGRPVLAHYAAFDLGVLRHSYLEAGVPWPSLQLGCTVVLSRRTWPGLASYSLPVIAGWLGLDRFTHHDPTADSAACADVARAAIAHTDADSLDGAAAAVKVGFGRLEPDVYEPCRALWRAVGADLQAPDPDELDPEHPLYGAHVSFTGTLWSMTRREAAQMVVDAGGTFNQNPGRTTDYLVFGQQDFTKFVDGESSAKTKKALALIDDGYPLQIIEEAAFLRML